VNKITVLDSVMGSGKTTYMLGYINAVNRPGFVGGRLV
jgi:hypothetical protein